ncbi:hypothetical protein GGR54DRAFT_625376 [Hypoxylon sp. NC1633]|nr:hypothetical protein GGR54DRAFT_625376 [Hypoxylon sp. NC1633]
MAVPTIRIPSFSFTDAERVENQDHINSLLDHCATLLDSYREQRSLFDLRDASIVVEDAILMASDLGVCKSPPLAKCYTYKGHILSAMKEYQAARDAYHKASRTTTYNSADHSVSRQATNLATEMEQKSREEKRKGRIWSRAHRSDSSFLSTKKPASEHQDIRLTAIGPHRTCPPVQVVGAKRSVFIEKAGFHTLIQPQRVVQSDGVLAMEALPSSGIADRIRISIRRAVSNPSSRHLAVRVL